VQKLTIHISLRHARKLKDEVSWQSTLFTYVFHDSCPLCNTCAFFIGEGATLSTGRKIDGTYLDFNEKEIKKHFQKFKDDWTTHGITLMCDS
jgi:hypothetical protein